MANGKVAIVTGAAMEIGKGIVQQMRDDYSHIVIADIAEEAGRNTVMELATPRCAVEFHKIDLVQDIEIEKLVGNVVGKYGRLDSLVCNAGIQIRHWATEFPMDEWDKLMRLNLRAYYVCCKTVARHMKNRGEQSFAFRP